MSERPYARVYYVDLERDYPEVWKDDAMLATFVRLLCLCEAAYPMRLEIPRSADDAAVERLLATGLVFSAGGFTFGIKGMDAERNARSNAARNAAASRWSDARAMPNRTEPNQTKPNRLPSNAAIEEDEPYVVAYFNATGKAPSKLQRAKLFELCDRHSVEWLVANLTGDDPLGHAFEADTAWQAQERRKASADERAWTKAKRAEAQAAAKSEVTRAYFGGDAA